jgi:phosphatidylserine/phosphatidylglycerophosphate/cardiolipin synthase-like enzyme
VLNELKSSYQRGAKIQMVLDDPTYDLDTSSVKFLTENNIPHKLDEKNSGYLEKTHAKAFLFDDKILYIGSHNWSRDSLNSAGEASIITRNSQTISDYLTIFNNKWSLAINP